MLPVASPSGWARTMTDTDLPPATSWKLGSEAGYSGSLKAGCDPAAIWMFETRQISPAAPRFRNTKVRSLELPGLTIPKLSAAGDRSN